MRMISKVVMKVVGLGMILFPLLASGAEPTVKWGLGTRSCAEFAQDFKQDPELWETLYYSWAEGFMTGFNLVRSTVAKRDFDLNPYGRSENWRRGSIREYCGTHPLSPYSEAAANLIVELSKP